MNTFIDIRLECYVTINTLVLDVHPSYVVRFTVLYTLLYVIVYVGCTLILIHYYNSFAIYILLLYNVINYIP